MFLKFLAVGAVSFFIAEFALFLLYDVLPVLPDHGTRFAVGPLSHPDISLLLASVVAVEIAIIFKFYAHEHWTFPHRPQPGATVARFLKFNASCILSPIITISTVNILTPAFGISPYIAVSIGTLLGFVANWYFSAHLIWRHREPTASPESLDFQEGPGFRP
jgi:putative flippase GtrA